MFNNSGGNVFLVEYVISLNNSLKNEDQKIITIPIMIKEEKNLKKIKKLKININSQSTFMIKDYSKNHFFQIYLYEGM